MSSVLERPPTVPVSAPLDVTPTVRRLGHVLVAVTNVVLLWVAHQVLGWGWPGFLTTDVELVMGLVTVVLLASMATSLALAFRPPARVRLLAELVRVGFVLALALRLLEVFPFDFTSHATDWSGLLRPSLIIGIAAAVVAMVVKLVRLLSDLEGDELLDPRPGRHM